MHLIYHSNQSDYYSRTPPYSHSCKVPICDNAEQNRHTCVQRKAAAAVHDWQTGPPRRGVGQKRGPHEALKLISGLHLIFHFPLDCLDSVSERLGRIISDAFTVRLDQHFGACKHVEPTPLVNWPHLLYFCISYIIFAPVTHETFSLGAPLGGPADATAVLLHDTSTWKYKVQRP